MALQHDGPHSDPTPGPRNHGAARPMSGLPATPAAAPSSLFLPVPFLSRGRLMQLAGHKCQHGPETTCRGCETKAMAQECLRLRGAPRKNPATRDLKKKVNALKEERDRLRSAIVAHRSQKADDRCIEDDDRLYEALDDGIRCDRRVGDKEAMRGRRMGQLRRA